MQEERLLDQGEYSGQPSQGGPKPRVHTQSLPLGELREDGCSRLKVTLHYMVKSHLKNKQKVVPPLSARSSPFTYPAATRMDSGPETQWDSLAFSKS